MHHFYRTLDILGEMKDDLERYLYNRFTGPLSYQLNLVFYDLTTSYFEGPHCPLARFGYSREEYQLIDGDNLMWKYQQSRYRLPLRKT